MYHLLLKKEYRTEVIFYCVITLLLFAELIYTLINPKHYVVMAFFVAFRVAYLYKIKKLIPSTTYLKIYWLVNIISLLGTIYFIYNNNYESSQYNALMLFFIGANNIFFEYYSHNEENKRLQNKKSE